jgi:RNA binding exosome subunit
MQTDLNGRVDPTDVLDQILTRWDDEDYDTELENLDSVIDDNAAWLGNADQQRRDNARASS